VGDALYGGVKRSIPAGTSAVRPLGRPFLHAAQLSFAHPRGGERLTFEAPLPPDLQTVLDALRSTAARTAASSRRVEGGARAHD
jgi:23S rRNA pseudouridine1911/1915/1917 synthase